MTILQVVSIACITGALCGLLVLALTNVVWPDDDQW